MSRIILFADKLPPNIGGMETHAHYFAQYFNKVTNLVIISKLNGKDVLVDSNYNVIKEISLFEYLANYANDKNIVFYNSGRWIERFKQIKEILFNSLFCYRTGGNEIIKAPMDEYTLSYEDRKKYWTTTINNTIDILVTNSAYTEKRLIDIGINPSILYKIAGGVDISVIDKAIELRNTTREKYGLTSSDNAVVCCARFVPYKRMDFLIEAFMDLKTDATLLIAGDGPLEETMKMKAQDYPNIKFIGKLKQEEAVNLIAAGDVYAQASTNLIVEVPGGEYVHTEGMGRSLLEAICVGTPVVVSNCGALSEYITKDIGCLITTKSEMAISIDDYLINKNRNVNPNYKAKYSFLSIFKEYDKLWKSREY